MAGTDIALRASAMPLFVMNSRAFSAETGSRNVLSRDFSPAITATALLEQPSVLAKNTHNAAFALPSSGTAATRTRKRPLLTSSASSFDAPGETLSRSNSASSSTDQQGAGQDSTF